MGGLTAPLLAPFALERHGGRRGRPVTGGARAAPTASCAGSPASPASQGLRHGQRVPLEFFTFGERHRRKSTILHVNWSW